MSVLASYREVKRLYENQRALAPYKGMEAIRMPNQLRVDISPLSVSVATVTANTFKFVNCYACDQYAGAMAKAAAEIEASHFLKTGFSLILTLWPEEARHGTEPVGASQKLVSAKAVDEKLQKAPHELRLDLNYAYRAIQGKSWSQVDYVGIKLDGWAMLQKILPSGVLVARHWGPLAVLEVLMAHFEAVFAKETVVLGMVDTFHVYYFKMEKGEFARMRIAPREAIKDTSDLKKTLQVFEMKKSPSVYVVDLTADSSETDMLCLLASQHEKLEMHMVDRAELMQAFKALASAGSAPLFPVALLQGGLHG